MGITSIGKRQEIAIGIALQTQVLKTCPIHNQLYCNDGQCSDDDDGNMARAFSIAIELVREHPPYAAEFHRNPHELTDLLSYTIAAAPASCPECRPQPYARSEAAEGRTAAGT
jgi:hypothetical protein